MSPAPPSGLPGYAELHCLTNFSFQRGASHPEELVRRAHDLGYQALAITDECSVAGVVRAFVGLREHRAALDRQNQPEQPQPSSRPQFGAGPSSRLPQSPPLPPPPPHNPAFRLLCGSQFVFEHGTLVALAHDLQGWGHLCEYISSARMTAPKGEYRVRWDSAELAALRHCELLFAPRRRPMDATDLIAICQVVTGAAAVFGSNLWLAVELFHEADDALWVASLRQLSARTGVPLVAAGDVHMHVRSRKPLQDAVTAVRLGRAVADCGFALQPNAERHLRSRLRLAGLYAPEWLANTLEVARRCRFSLEQIRYHYPMESVPAGCTPAQALRRLVEQGLRQRYPQGAGEPVLRQIEHELALIAEKRYEMYFLTVEDIVRYARSQHILCQGRGSAANSVVCYCLGITEVPPELASLLFERFLSRQRNEPPDIDVDFEHSRREEVIQYIYRKYGRERAAIAAVVVRYRPRMAIRDAGKALGIAPALIDRVAKDHQWFDLEVLVQQAGHGADGTDRAPAQPPLWQLRQWGELAAALCDFPRHLSQHVGGFVLTQDRLTRLVPVENAAMPERSVIQWEKEDLEAVGLMKVDVLALGMLSALRRCLELRNAWRGGTPWTLTHIPRNDPRTFDMICDADTIGVFQIESRAQMSMLPRLKPRTFYDLVVEVAIVRPGPIQGGMVHPYLQARRRIAEGKDIHYIRPQLERSLKRTLGVPIFQEQVMQLSMDAAGFSADEADALRRAMAAWTRKGRVNEFRGKLIQGLLDNGYPLDFAERLFKQIEGFGEYGFPESHAASFALLVLVSSWLKLHEPACFLAALLDSQPMGFYSPAQLVQDARRHGVEVRPVDVSLSGFDSRLEARRPGAPGASHVPDAPGLFDAPGAPDVPPPIDPRYRKRLGDPGQPAVRLGLGRIQNLSQAGAERLLAARAQAPFSSVEDLALRAGLDARDMAALAAADALASLAGHRRQQVWQATGVHCTTGGMAGSGSALLQGVPIDELPLALPPAPEGEEIVGDYAALGLTLRRHPLALLRPLLTRMKLLSAEQLRSVPNGRRVRACGIVKGRQRPGTAKGTIFVTLEDETGNVNVIVWLRVFEAWREAVLHSKLLAVHGTWQRDTDSGGRVQHLVADSFEDLTPLIGALAHSNRSRDFH